ncbi:MAG TPA: hypothetical protein VLW83_18840 [Candidatus Acidoferrales bacterium]|nr:hypothetical protein [Candidatus Acidoferrales bacterium]
MSHRDSLTGNMARLIAVVLACWTVSSIARAQSSQSVLYSVTTSEADSGIPVYKTQLSKTEIFAVDPETGKQRLVFSDANSPFFLMPGGGMQGGIAAAGGKIFAEGILAVQTLAHTPYFDPSAPAAIYELSTDGSGKARKVLDMGNAEQRVNFRSLFFNSSGTKFGDINYVAGKWSLFVHDTETGKLLRKSDLVAWKFGSVENIGWMPDDKRIFFTVYVSGDDPEAWWTTPNSPVGTYVLGEADTIERLAPEASLHPRVAGLQPSNDSPAVFIGTLPNGAYLLQDYQSGPRSDSDTCPYEPALANNGHACLYELDLARKTQRMFPFHADAVPDNFRLSTARDRLVFTSTKVEYQKQPKFKAISTLSIWVLDIESDREWNVISFLPQDDTRPIGPRVNLIGWLDSR